MKKAIGIIGAGPAGLTAAYELTRDAQFRPLIFEAASQVGGLSKTILHNNNRMDLGGHRFFSKSDKVNSFWEQILPFADDESQEKIMLRRNRLSRILFDKKYYDYPVSPNFGTLQKLGFIRLSKIAFTYLQTIINPIKPEKTLEDFFINRFGRELYHIFFEQYTEKVWGVPCRRIPKDWGAQRIKGLSISKALQHAMLKAIKSSTLSGETSLIESFKYPKYGPGQFWEETAGRVIANGGELHLETKVIGLSINKEKRITALQTQRKDGEIREIPVDEVISSMPIKELIALLPNVPDELLQIALALPYRDFVTVGLSIKKNQKTAFLKDNWIYIQEPDLQAGRIQIFNNWSPYLVSDPSLLWVGLEYFCQEGDNFWSASDADIIQIASNELRQIGYISAPSDVLDAVVVRISKAYPAYFGSYAEFPQLIDYFSQYPNLYLVGRNGMHKYNNMDHSMLTAMYAADLIKGIQHDKSSLWRINTEETYHESRETGKA